MAWRGNWASNRTAGQTGASVPLTTVRCKTRRWAAIKALFHQDPWQGQGPYGPKAKMAFMATYNMDAFRSFIFESSFLKRYRVKKERVRKMRKDDLALLGFGFEWIKLAVWNIPSKWIRRR